MAEGRESMGKRPANYTCSLSIAYRRGTMVEAVPRSVWGEGGSGKFREEPGGRGLRVPVRAAARGGVQGFRTNTRLR